MIRERRGNVVFVGDEVTALGFRLAGVATLSTGSGLSLTDSNAAVVLVTPESARNIPRSLSGAQAVVIRSASSEGEPEDFANYVRRQLGILS